MSVIYLVRHGQASLLGRDYDKLSATGVVQSRTVGAALAQRGVQPDRIVRGDMVRHRETTTAAIAAAGWESDDVPVDVDPAWNEIDHIDIIKARQPTYTSHAAMVDQLVERPDPGQAFRTVFDDALQVWLGGSGGYVESHLNFRARVDRALGDVVRRLGAAETVVVFSSGGPVAGVVATALGLEASAWLSVSRLIINASVTKLVCGESGVTLVSFNDHAHVEAAGQLTYH